MYCIFMWAKNYQLSSITFEKFGKTSSCQSATHSEKLRLELEIQEMTIEMCAVLIEDYTCLQALERPTDANVPAPIALMKAILGRTKQKVV